MLFRASQTNADVMLREQYWATAHSSAFKPIGAKSLRFVYPNSSLLGLLEQVLSMKVFSTSLRNY